MWPGLVSGNKKQSKVQTSARTRISQKIARQSAIVSIKVPAKGAKNGPININDCKSAIARLTFFCQTLLQQLQLQVHRQTPSQWLAKFCRLLKQVH